MASIARRAVFAGILAVSLLGPRAGHCLDLGLTPSQVYGLWTNINASLLEITGVVLEDEELRDQLAAMPAREFVNKRPADVLAQAKRYRAKLDKLREGAALERTQRIAPHRGRVTPSVVYLTSSEVLHAQVELLVRITGPEQLVSRFYDRQNSGEKTPSHVFALVDLATRRFERILADGALSHVDTE